MELEAKEEAMEEEDEAMAEEEGFLWLMGKNEDENRLGGFK